MVAGPITNYTNIASTIKIKASIEIINALYDFAKALHQFFFFFLKKRPGKVNGKLLLFIKDL